jgi:fluoride exporter
VTTAIAFVLAAGLGALARAEAGRRWNKHAGFPYGTLVVNVTGSFLLGALATAAPPVVTVVGVGCLGAYTTFSSFARDAVAVAEAAGLRSAVVYVASSCGGAIAAAAFAIALFDH